MATTQLSQVVPHLRRAVLRHDGAGMTDGQLLGRFVEQRDEAAFAALVKRHGPMVWGVCCRLLPHHDAEDAFQATFLVLVRKAASVRPWGMVANWLYGVARQTALKARATAAKRRTRERQVTPMPEVSVAEQDLWHDLRPLLDQELARLPDKYRVAIVLCDLEGKTRKEAARQLGCPEGTLAARLARGRSMLARRLARHGLAVSGGVLAGVLSQGAASAGVPPSAVASTIKAASLVAAGQAAGVISAKVATLMEGVLKTMLLTKLKVITAVLLLAALSSGAGLVYRTPAADQPQGLEATEKPKSDKGGPQGTKDEIGRLQGTWRAVAAVNDGNKVSVGSPNLNHRLVVDKTSLKLFDLGEPEAGKAVADFTLDTKRTPKVIVLAWKNSPFGASKEFTQEAIYELEGDTLKLCLSMDIPDDLKAPTEFSSKAGSRRGLWTFKRELQDKEKPSAPKKGKKNATQPSGRAGSTQAKVDEAAAAKLQVIAGIDKGAKKGAEVVFPGEWLNVDKDDTGLTRIASLRGTVACSFGLGQLARTEKSTRAKLLSTFSARRR
jgi:RNA polymerase sigma factor (sigma-70 family)